MRGVVSAERQLQHKQRLADERRSLRSGNVVCFPSVPDDVLAERTDRPTRHRSLTAMMMGDPLPGRSALDQRLAQMKG